MSGKRNSGKNSRPVWKAGREFLIPKPFQRLSGRGTQNQKALFLKDSYKRFIFFVMDQIKNITPQKANYSGCGFSYDTPMGGYNQKKKVDLYNLTKLEIV